jgi:hypothetical protein
LSEHNTVIDDKVCESLLPPRDLFGRTSGGQTDTVINPYVHHSSISLRRAAAARSRGAIWQAHSPLDLMVGKIGFSYEPILAFPTRQGCTPESYELVATFISV